MSNNKMASRIVSGILHVLSRILAKIYVGRTTVRPCYHKFTAVMCHLEQEKETATITKREQKVLIFSVLFNLLV